MQTSDAVMGQVGWLIDGLDEVCLGDLRLELVLKLYFAGPRFFLGGWNFFDFIVVGSRWCPAGRGFRCCGR